MVKCTSRHHLSDNRLVRYTVFTLPPHSHRPACALSGCCKCSVAWRQESTSHASWIAPVLSPVRQATWNNTSQHSMPSRGCRRFKVRICPLGSCGGGHVPRGRASVCPIQMTVSHVCQKEIKDCSGMDLPISQDREFRRTLSSLRGKRRPAQYRTTLEAQLP